MINHINKKSLDILAGIMNQHVDNIFSQKLFGFTPDRSQKELDENNAVVIYLQIQDSYIEIVNDEFTTFYSDEINSIDIAIKITISGHDYFIIAWDAIQGNLSFIDKSTICKEDFWLIRSQISEFWINKDIDLRYFYRKEIPISDRLNN